MEQPGFHAFVIAIIFHYKRNNSVPIFISDKTAASDLRVEADLYIKRVKELHSKSEGKWSLAMDVWTGPNKTSFLGITYAYFDNDLIMCRGTLELAPFKTSHTGKNIGLRFMTALELYGIIIARIGSITQDNASNCLACIDFLVSQGFDRNSLLPCFLHILNLACLSIIKVYDPKGSSVTEGQGGKAAKAVLLSEEEESDYFGSEDSDSPDDPTYDDEIADVENVSNVIRKVFPDFTLH